MEVKDMELMQQDVVPNYHDHKWATFSIYMMTSNWELVVIQNLKN